MEALWDGARLHLWTRTDASNGVEGQPEPRPLRELIGEISTDGLLASVAVDGALDLAFPPPTQTTSVPTLTLGPSDAVDFLTDLRPPHGITLGDSLVFWSLIARFIHETLIAQQFVPAMHENADGRIIARWRPAVPKPASIAWLERMVQAMPPVCRASRASDAARDAVMLIDSFLAESTDATIRRCVMNDPFFEDVHERAREEGRWELRWLSALLGGREVVEGQSDELVPLSSEIAAWAAQLNEETPDSPTRLCLRLHEPHDADEDTDAPWRLSVELRSGPDDTVVDLATVWNERDSAAMILGRRWGSRRAHVRAELTRAARIYPMLSRLTGRTVLTGLSLTTAEAHSFLREHAALLAAEDIEVVLPDWAHEAERRLGLQLVLHTPDDGGPDVSLRHFGLGTLLDFDWRVAIGDEQLSLEEFEKLARRKAALVKIRGRWISLDKQSATKAIDFLRQERGGKMTLMSALRLAGGADESSEGLPIVGVTGEAWLSQFLRSAPEVSVDTLPQPQGFEGEMRPYQLRGLAWLAFLHRLGIGACLADDMGLGKTIQFIALLLHERTESPQIGPTLLFAPMSVVGNWQREIQRFAPSLRAMVHHGPLRLTGDAFVSAATNHDVVLTTYGLASRCRTDFTRVPWHRIALDEAQKIKNPSAAQTVALRGLSATYRVALTGTPIENHLSELWSIMEVLNPGLLGSSSSFRTRFAIPIEKLGDQDRATQLRRLVQPFLLRRLKSDPAVACDLPEKMDMRVYCNLTAEQAAFYERVVADLMKDVDQAAGIQRRGMILAALTRLKQVCNHPAHFLKTPGPLDGRSGKCERLVEMLEEVLDEGDAALVFTQFREMGDLLERLLADRLGIEVPFLHGGTPMKKRNEMIDRFQLGKDRLPVFLLSLKAGGFGLNLTKANHVFHFDRWWNPAVEEQATDRVHRIGQTQIVQVHKFVCIGTVEERIDKLLAEKAALAERIVGGGDEWLTGMSTRELRDYLKLTDDAVAEM